MMTIILSLISVVLAVVAIYYFKKTVSLKNGSKKIKEEIDIGIEKIKKKDIEILILNEKVLSIAELKSKIEDLEEKLKNKIDENQELNILLSKINIQMEDIGFSMQKLSKCETKIIEQNMEIVHLKEMNAKLKGRLEERKAG